jgi:hypothetical protein
LFLKIHLHPVLLEHLFQQDLERLVPLAIQLHLARQYHPVLLEHLILQDPELLELLVIQLRLVHQYHPVLLEHQHLTVPQLLVLLMDLLILERLVTQHLKRLVPPEPLVRLALPEHLKEKFLP